MSGRAGRRGIDKVGHVIHLNNLFRDVDSVSYKKMMNGKPQSLTSKFKISYNLILNLIDIGEIDYTRYTKKSMIQGDIDNITKQYNTDMLKLQGEIANIQKILDKSKIPIEKVEEYIELKEKRLTSVNKKRKEVDRSIQNIVNEYMDIDKDVDTVSRFNLKRRELNNLHDQLTATQSTLETNVKIIMCMLEDANMVIKDNDTGLYGLTLKGRIATHLKEVHCLIFAEMIESNKFRLFEAKELVGILSCFTNISVSEDKRAISCSTEYTNVKKTVMELSDMYQKQSNLEAQCRIDTGVDYSIHFDLIDYVIKWCECDSEVTCKQLLQQLGEEKEIFLGEFVKAILKINNITAEMEKIAETLGDVEFLSVLKQVPQLTLKYVATNQSLYV
jgi:superfamily II RNA helicase